MAAIIQTIETPKRWRAQDTSGNNNHGQIYSGRGLEFDGVTDYLKPVDGNIDASNAGASWSRGTSGDGYYVTNATGRVVPLKVTIAFWINTNQVGTTKQLQDQYGAEMDIELLSSGALYVAYLNDNYGVDAGNDHPAFTGSTILEKNTWYRVVVIYNMQEGSTPIEIYINGVKETGTFNGELGATGNRAYKRTNIDDNYYIGTYGLGVRDHFDGMLSDWQIWLGNWTADDAAFDYANPEQLALNRGGTSLTESNLKLWYPMNDGHRGQQSYVLDASNTGLGDDVVSDGGFDTDTAASTTGTYWTTQAGWVISNGVATHDGDGTLVYSSVGHKNIVSGTTYKVTFDWVQTSTDSNDGLEFRDYGSSYTTRYEETGHSGGGSGSSEFYFTSDTTNGSLYLRGVNGWTGTVDNVVVKPVNDKNHATTVFYGDELNTQANAVTPEHSSASEANDTANWTNSNFNTFASSTDNETQGTYSMKFIGDSSGDYAHTNFTTTIVGRTYRMQWDRLISNHTADKLILFKIGTSADNNTNGEVNSWGTNQAQTSITGEYKDFVATATTTFFTVSAHGDGDAELYLDNLSLREKGTATGWTDADQQLDIPQTALQSYNQLAWWNERDDSMVDITPSSGLWNTTDGQWNCVSCWVFLNKDDGMFAWFADSNPGLWIKQSGSDFNIGINTGQSDVFGFTDAETLWIGRWRHIVCNFKRDSHGSNAETTTSDVEIFTDGEKRSISYVANNGSDESSAMDVVAGTDLQIGSYTGSGYGFHGSITEVCVFTDQLTQAEVNELYNDGKALDATTHSNSTNLTGYWRNNGLATWTNLANPGTNDGAVNNLTETILQQAGVDASRDCQGFLMNRQKDTNALNLADGLDTVDDVDNITYAAMSDNPLDLSEDFSVSLWFKPHRQYSSGIQSFIQLNDDDANHFTVGMPGDDQKIGASIETTAGGLSRSVSASNDATNIGEGKWTHVVVCGSSGVSTGNNSATLVDSGAAWIVDELIGGRVWDDTDNQGATITDNTATVVTGALSGSDDWDTDDKYTITKVYVNGSVNTQTIIDNTGMPAGTDSDNTYFIGSDNTAQRQVNGQIDDVLCYQKWLTAAEVKRNYNAGKRSHR